MKNFLYILLLWPALYQAQEPRHCGADEMRIQTLKQNPAIAKAVIRREAQLEAETKAFVNQFGQQKTSTATYIIPVVFHVIHQYGPENISAAQIYDGIDILNKTFRKQLADTGSIVQAFKSLHADCDIEFRLAQKDPNGNCHSGINRVTSSLTTSGDHRVKSLIHWPPDKYLNIYVVSNAAGLAGHCVWPVDADTIPAWDGIVIGYNYVGSIGQSSYLTSVALAHECGHYLNLHHIWGGNNVPNFYYYPCGDPNKDCSIDDLVADTPPTIGWQSCNLAAASCSNTVDNVQNAMDYSYCNRMFTYGQKARMQACLQSTIAARSNLWTNSNLNATGVLNAPVLCAADFTSNKTVVCQSSGNQVAFSNAAYNGTFTSVYWRFEGGTPAVSSVSNPTVTYSTAGSYSVELVVRNGVDSVKITRPHYITALPAGGASYPFSEGFETTGAFFGPDWYINSASPMQSWSLSGSAAYSGATSAMVAPAAGQLGGASHELISKTFNLAGASALNISFRYAFARRDTANHDQLRLFVSNTCNGSWVQRLSISGAVLETAPMQPGAFVPSGQGQWRQASASIPTPWLTAGFRFKLQWMNDGGNNLYIDDINLDPTAGIDDLAQNLGNLSLYPNPAAEAVNLGFELQAPALLQITLSNLLGQVVYEGPRELYGAGAQELRLQTGHLPSGVYLLKIAGKSQNLAKTLVISQN